MKPAACRVARVYCAKAARSEWRRRERRNRARDSSIGLVLAVENGAGRFICGGCGKAVRPVRTFRAGGVKRLREVTERAPP